MMSYYIYYVLCGKRAEEGKGRDGMRKVVFDIFLFFGRFRSSRVLQIKRVKIKRKV